MKNDKLARQETFSSRTWSRKRYGYDITYVTYVIYNAILQKILHRMGENHREYTENKDKAMTTATSAGDQILK